MEQIIRINDGADVTVDIKPCPFCGSAPEIAHIGNSHTKSQGIRIKCSNRICRVERTDKVIHRPIEWIIPKSVERWNRRTPTGDTHA